MRKVITLCFVLVCGCFFKVSAQRVKNIITALDSVRSRLPIEKLYLQTDKPYYTLGDTLWFKSYLLNADYLTPSTKSGLLYLELDNTNNQMVKRIMVPVTSGISFGDIVLDEEDLPEGSYTLRAYTNWMRNFGEDYIFKKNIYISAISNSTLVKASFKLDSIAGKNKVEASLTFTNLNKDALRLKDMQLKVMNGRHNLIKDKATTGMDGSLNINFDLADKTQLNNLSIIANQTGKIQTDTSTLTIPVTISRPEDMDVQFMPEGGSLVAGIPTKVGFKAIGEDGKGTEVSGKIINSKNQTITPIQTIHKGMGSFELTPEPNESYMAIINLPNKTTKSYPLPKINPEGTALRVNNKEGDSLEVIISNTTINNNYYLIGQSRGVVCYAATIGFKGQTIKKAIATNLFPTGIARLTLLNNLNEPLNERIVYINHNDNLDITVNTNKPNYAIRDSIALNIEVKDKDNNPVHGTFALAVTDNDQVKPDIVGNNIINDLLFTSDLRGTVEEPGWYFEQLGNSTIKQSNNETNKTIALDNLLLTQGWVGYDWKQVFSLAVQPQFSAEKSFIIQGKVTNIFNKPVKLANITLLQKQPAMVMDTLTDNEGHFTFKSSNLFPPDSAYYLIQAKNKKGNAFNLDVEVNEFTPPVFANPKQEHLPWYINSDTTLLNNAAAKASQLKAEAAYKGEGNLLKEVEIKDKKIIPDSHNLNGPGEADITLNEKDMNAAKKMTLYELLQKHFKYFYKGDSFGYDLNGRKVALVIDGVFVSKLHVPVDLYMNFLTAEDIKGIEIMIQPRYVTEYLPDIVYLLTHNIPEITIPLFLEITTYSGHGAYLAHTPGRYVYKPIGFSVPKQFYRPRYTIKNKDIAPGTDLRATIHWEPNVITDKDGKATVSFFSADKLSDYTVIIEGTDLNGSLGYKKQKLKVNVPTVQK